MKMNKKNKRLTLYWVDKLKELQEEHAENPLKALYLFEAWAVKEEDEFNERWYNKKENEELLEDWDL